jgi:hypothetical protein
MSYARDRGRHIADKDGAIVTTGTRNLVFAVASQSQPGKSYLVNFARKNAPRCGCNDHMVNLHMCKHIWAVRFLLERTTPEQMEKAHIPRAAIPRDWRAYNAAATRSTRDSAALLAELCKGLPELPHLGRRGIAPEDMLYATGVAKMRADLANRAASEELADLAAAGHIGSTFHFNGFSRFLRRASTTVYLDYLIDATASLFGEVEDTVAWDSSGFGTTKRGRWAGHKWGSEYLMERAEFIKMHLAVGTRSHIIVACDVSADSGVGSGDSPHLRSQVARVKRNLPNAKLGVADKAYIADPNLEACEDAGIELIVRPKSNTTGKKSERIRRLKAKFDADPERCNELLGKRQNVESTFASIKTRFTEDVRSKHFIAQVNEALFIALIHNLDVIVHAIHENGLVVPWLSQPDGEDEVA